MWKVCYLYIVSMVFSKRKDIVYKYNKGKIHLHSHATENVHRKDLTIAKKMAEMDINENPFVEKELDNKLVTLQAFIDKMDELIDELIIHMGSNKEDTNDINNLFNEMDDLIDSVKDY